MGRRSRFDYFLESVISGTQACACETCVLDPDDENTSVRQKQM